MLRSLRKIILIAVILFLSYLHISRAQAESDRTYDSSATVKKCCFLKKQVIPAGLIVSGLALTGKSVKEDLQKEFPRTSTKIDNYLQWSPGFIMYGADIMTSHHKNNVFNQTKYLFISLLATAGITQLIKVSTHVTRPNGGSLSFPSGHTSNAFAGATVMYEEYHDYYPVAAYSGYLLSSATGILRITNNRHWVPDVLVGAGLGIVITRLVCYLEPLKNWDPFGLSKNDRVAFIPGFDPGTKFYGFSLRIKF